MTDKENDNMKIWDKVSKTDPDHTKEVSFGRKFTAIDAHSQIMAATELFGPIGQGWGYDTVFGFQETPRGEVFVWCDLKFWWSVEGEWEGNKTRSPRCGFGPIRGMAALQGVKIDGNKPKPSDHDAAKKAMTDALTKGLSHLGFNADVFLGKFDDNKYVSQLKSERAREEENELTSYRVRREGFVKKIQACTGIEALDTALDSEREWIATLEKAVAQEIHTWVAKQRLELEK